MRYENYNDIMILLLPVSSISSLIIYFGSVITCILLLASSTSNLHVMLLYFLCEIDKAFFNSTNVLLCSLYTCENASTNSFDRLALVKASLIRLEFFIDAFEHSQNNVAIPFLLYYY